MSFLYEIIRMKIREQLLLLMLEKNTVEVRCIWPYIYISLPGYKEIGQNSGILCITPRACERARYLRYKGNVLLQYLSASE